MAAPPLTRQFELGRPQAPADAQRAVAFDARDERISDTWRHVQQVAQDNSKDYDLLDLLTHTSREEAYQFPVQGWPSLLRPVSPAMTELPQLIQDKYRACQTMCFCGVFPQLRRAWASVDNSLFLWRYDKKDDVPLEYASEEQAISCVGLVTPKPGVFMESMAHLLVVATTTEIVLLGLCVGSKPTSSDPYAELELQQLPLYTLPSDNVIITCCASTPAGRIFLGGSDGHLYELTYAASDSWRHKRCQKVRVTGGLGQLLPSFLPSFLLGTPAALEQVVVDPERHVLYTLAADNMLQVFDLGPKGTDPARKVADAGFMDAASRAASSTGTQVFRAGDDPSRSAVKYIAPIPSRESARLHLLAVTADGRRCYFSFHPYVQRFYNPTSAAGSSTQPPNPAATRPQALVAAFARPAVPAAAGVVSGRGALAAAGSSSVNQVMSALYADGCLLLGEAAGNNSRCCRLTAVTRSHTLPPASTAVTSSTGPGYRELVGELGQVLPGEAVALAVVPSSSSLGPEMAGRLKDELLAQVFCRPQRFVLVGTAGVLEVERRRPVDLLAGLLLEGSPAKLQQFFGSYGSAEAAAMCYTLATWDVTSMPAKLLEAALEALDSPSLVGEPTMPEDAPPGEGAGTAASNGIYMGAAVNPNPEPVWSGAHTGLCVFLRRLLAPVWEARCVEPLASNPALLKAALSEQTLQSLEVVLQSLVRFLRTLAERRKPRSFQQHAQPGGGLAAAPGAGFLGAPGGLFGGGAGGAAGAGAGAAGGFGGFGAGIMQDMTARALNVGAGLGAGGEGADVQPHKRQRMWTAFLVEEQRNSAVRALASRISQALLLLRTLSSQNITRLAARLERGAAQRLRELTLRDLVYDNSGLATSLIGALVGEALEGGAGGGGGREGVSELAGLLQAGAPDYFKEQDKVFYQGVSQLSAAETAGTPGERAALAADALSHLLRVPQCCDLDTLTKRLASLRQWKGIVELALRAAAAADPEHAAWRDAPSHPDTAAARERRGAAYRAMFGLLLSLLGAGDAAPLPQVFPLEVAPAAAAGAQGAAAPALRDMTPAEVSAAKKEMLQACGQSTDQYLHHALYSLLMSLPGGPSELLALDPPHLEAYLRQEGGLAGITPGAASPSLTKRQVQHLRLLCRLHVQKGRYSAAAQVYRVLAERRSGPGEAGVTLGERLEDMTNALLQARSVGDEMLVEGLQASCRLLRLQQATAAQLAQQLAEVEREGDPQGSAAGLRAELEALSSSCVAVSDLYNQYTQPHGMWDLCLDICDFAGNVPAEYVRQLWDLLLKATAEAALQEAAAAAAGPGPSAEGTSRALEACCAKVAELGSRFYPNESSFPLDHVTLRLEQLAAGLWPEPRPAAATDPSRVVRCLRAACAAAGANLSSLIAGVYQGLLTKRGDAGSAGELQIAGAAAAGGAAPLQGPLRLGLLRSLAAHCSIVLQEELSSGLAVQADFGYNSRFAGRGRAADLLAELAQRCAAEVRTEDPMLAAEFDRVVKQLPVAPVGGGW